MFYMSPMVPHTLYEIGIIWSPTCTYGPHTLYGIGIIWPPHVHMVPHVKCLQVLYDSYGLPHTLYGIGIIWSPTCTYDPLHMSYMTYGPPYLIWNRYLMVPLTLYETVIVWSPLCTYGPPHVKYLHVLYDSYGPSHTLYGIGILWFPLPYMEQVSSCPHTCMYSPPT